MKRIPSLLVAGCAFYLLMEILILASGAEPRARVVVRIAITLALFFFVLRGSRAAAIIWGVCNLLGGLIAGYASLLFMWSSPGAGALFLLVGLLGLANAAYLFFSPAVRAFQRAAAPIPE